MLLSKENLRVSGTRLLPAFLFIASLCMGQNTITIKRKRPPQMDISKYEKIAVGDIVGPTGSKTTRSMDLTDALTSHLFNANSYEVIDRNALAEILSAQRGTEIKAINETAAAGLSKKLSSAIMIIGRIQNEKVYSEKKEQRQMISFNGCTMQYWWVLSGDTTAQIKIIDIKAGRMLFSNSIVQPVALETKHECEPRKLGDTEPLLKQTTEQLARQIGKLLLPYDEQITLKFEKPFSLKNPFKKLGDVIEYFEGGNNEAALVILKEYADNASLKPETRILALYNYAVGLFIAERYSDAALLLKTVNQQGSLDVRPLLKQIEAESQYQTKLAVKK
ncbi:CsgG/HfaB family protein [Arcticibacter sp. MXS-1]|uniref:CsgG/HfaB family protein n=1 Tax=Arcticibacter sp. MXS-1 TaxID=3341726 RepID=UPI0035A99121